MTPWNKLQWITNHCSSSSNGVTDCFDIWNLNKFPILPFLSRPFQVYFGLSPNKTRTNVVGFIHSQLLGKFCSTSRTYASLFGRLVFVVQLKVLSRGLLLLRVVPIYEYIMHSQCKEWMMEYRLSYLVNFQLKKWMNLYIRFICKDHHFLGGCAIL